MLLNKALGLSSHDLVAKVRSSLGTKAVGHTGTLDPMAEGLMVLVLEKATRLSPWLSMEEKTYSGRVCLGQSTSTGDQEGEVIKDFGKKDWPLEKVKEAALSLRGEQCLRVPRFSAIKVKGERLYKKARAGESFEPPFRTMHFYESRVDKMMTPKEALFYVRCSKGSYIRSWAEGLGESLGSGAYLRQLKRESVGGFSLKEALDLKFFKDLKGQDDGAKVRALKSSLAFVPLEEALPHTELLFLSEGEDRLFVNGQIPNKARFRLNPLIRKAINTKTDKIVRVLGQEQRLLGLLSLSSQGRVKITGVYS